MCRNILVDSNSNSIVDVAEVFSTCDKLDIYVC